MSLAEPTPGELARWALQCREWDSIGAEMVASGKSPSAYQVSLEQRKRMLARGERPVFDEDRAP